MTIQRTDLEIIFRKKLPSINKYQFKINCTYNLFFPLIKNSWLIHGQFMEIHVKKELVNVFFIRHEFP